MPKFKVYFDFKDSMIIEAENEDIAVENFLETYENTLAPNETVVDRVFESIKVKKVGEDEENNHNGFNKK
jgi:hypothetical protein